MTVSWGEFSPGGYISHCRIVAFFAYSLLLLLFGPSWTMATATATVTSNGRETKAMDSSPWVVVGEFVLGTAAGQTITRVAKQAPPLPSPPLCLQGVKLRIVDRALIGREQEEGV